MSRPASEDSGIAGLARGGALNLAGTLVGQLAGFAVLTVLAVSQGVHGLGLYSQAYAFLSLLELVALSGFRSGLTRYVAVHRADGDEAALRGTLRMGLGISLGVSILLGWALFAAAPWLAEQAFDDPELSGLLRIVALALPPTVFMHAALSATQGFFTMRYYAGIGLIGVPVLRVVLMAAFLAGGAGLDGAMAALVLSAVAGAVAAALALRSLIPPLAGAARYAVRELFSYSMISWLSNLANQGLLWASTLLLGLYLESADVGRYQVASRLVLFAALAMPPVNASFAPRIAYLHRRGERDELERTYVAATGWIIRLSLPAFVVLITFPGELTALFGNGFEVGWTVMALLLLGKLADTATGPCGIMLNQSGRVRLNLLDNIGVLVADVVLSIWLIPRHGLLGAALAWSLSMVAVNVARLLQVHRALQMWPFGPGTAKGAAGAAVGVAVAATVQVVAGGNTALVAGGLLAAGAYLATLAALGLSSDDRLALAVLLRRRPPEPRAELTVIGGAR